jgi:hypothetical protein
MPPVVAVGINDVSQTTACSGANPESYIFAPDSNWPRPGFQYGNTPVCCKVLTLYFMPNHASLSHQITRFPASSR